QVQGLFPVAQKIAGKLNDRPLVFSHQLSRCAFIAGRTALHQRGLTIADVRPTDDSCLFHPSASRSRGSTQPDTLFTITASHEGSAGLDPANIQKFPTAELP